MQEAAIASNRKFSERVKRQSEKVHADRVQAKLSKLLEENLDGIGQGLVKSAIDGNYNAAQLLLRVGGADVKPGVSDEADEDRRQARMFFLDLVEQMLGERLDGV